MNKKEPPYNVEVLRELAKVIRTEANPNGIMGIVITSEKAEELFPDRPHPLNYRCLIADSSVCKRPFYVITELRILNS